MFGTLVGEVKTKQKEINCMKVISKIKLEEMYRTMLNKDICKKFKISNPTLIVLLKEAGIKTKGPGNRAPKKKIKVI